MQNSSDSPSGGCDGEVNSILLFGVRVKIDPMRKSVSMNNLSEYEPPNSNPINNNTNSSDKTAANDLLKDGGYASADDVVPQTTTRERKRGVPWTEEEHKMFLIGLQKVGKGDWRGISRNYVKTRTPTQVASHAQKYFLRLTNINRRRRRSSLFDMTTASVTAMSIDEGRNTQESPVQQVPPPVTQVPPVAPNVNGFSVVPFPVTFSPVMMSMQGGNIMESSALAHHSDQMMMTSSSSLLATPPVPVPMPMDLNFNQQVLSLNLSLSSGNDQSSPARNSSFQMMPSFKNGDGILTSPA